MFICFAFSCLSIDDKVCVKQNGKLEKTPRVQFYVIYLNNAVSCLRINTFAQYVKMLRTYQIDKNETTFINLYLDVNQGKHKHG